MDAPTVTQPDGELVRRSPAYGCRCETCDRSYEKDETTMMNCGWAPSSVEWKAARDAGKECNWVDVIDNRSCTCHPSDNPPVSCARKFALSECRLADLTAEITRLRALCKRLSDALLKVGPLGGSELFIRVGDDHYADPDYCGAAIDKLRRDLHEARMAKVLRAREAEAEVASLKAVCAELIRAGIATVSISKALRVYEEVVEFAYEVDTLDAVLNRAKEAGVLT